MNCYDYQKYLIVHPTIEHRLHPHCLVVTITITHVSLLCCQASHGTNRQALNCIWGKLIARSVLLTYWELTDLRWGEM